MLYVVQSPGRHFECFSLGRFDSFPMLFLIGLEHRIVFKKLTELICIPMVPQALLPADKAEVASMSLEEGLEAALLSRRQKARRLPSSAALQINGPLVSRPSGDMELDPAALAPITPAEAMSIDAGTGAVKSKEATLTLELPVDAAAKDLGSHSGAGAQSGQEADPGAGTEHQENGLGADGFITPEERRVLDWHYANLEYGCAAPLGLVSLPHWNQDDPFGGFGGAHCTVKGGESLCLGFGMTSFDCL